VEVFIPPAANALLLPVTLRESGITTFFKTANDNPDYPPALKQEMPPHLVVICSPFRFFSKFFISMNFLFLGKNTLLGTFLLISKLPCV
jgi:hypothetical protein